MKCVINFSLSSESYPIGHLRRSKPVEDIESSDLGHIISDVMGRANIGHSK